MSKVFDIKGATLTNVGSLVIGDAYGGVALGFGTVAGPYSVALGYNATTATFTGSQANIAIGYSSGLAPGTSASTDNIAIGTRAAVAVSGGDDNIVLGADSAPTLNTGSSNIVVGHSGGGALTSGNNNVSIGGSSNAATTGDNNVAIGNSADAGTIGAGNVAIGNSSAAGVAGSSSGVAVGDSAIAGLGGTVAVGASAEANGYRGIALGQLAIANHTQSVTIGYDIESQIENETSVRGMRVIRYEPAVAADLSAGTGTPLVITYPGAGGASADPIHVEVTSLVTVGANSVMISKRDNLVVYGSPSTVTVGTTVTHDAGGLGDTMALAGIAGEQFTITYTGGDATARKPVIVIRIFGGIQT